MSTQMSKNNDIVLDIEIILGVISSKYLYLLKLEITD